MNSLENFPLEEQSALTSILSNFSQEPEDLTLDLSDQPPMELPPEVAPTQEPPSDRTQSVVMDWMLSQLNSAFIAYGVECPNLQGNITDAVMATALAGKLGDGTMSGETSAAINQQVEQLISAEFGEAQPVPMIVPPSVMGVMGIGESASVWGEKGNGFDQDPDKVLDTQQQETLDYAKQELGSSWESKLKKIWAEESYEAYPDCFDELDINELEQIKVLMGGELTGLKADAANSKKQFTEAFEGEAGDWWSSSSGEIELFFPDDSQARTVEDFERLDKTLQDQLDQISDETLVSVLDQYNFSVRDFSDRRQNEILLTQLADSYISDQNHYQPVTESRDDTDEFMLEVDAEDFLYDEKVRLFRKAGQRRGGPRVFASDISRHFRVPRGVSKSDVAKTWTEELIDEYMPYNESISPKGKIMEKKKAEPKDSLAFIFDLIGIDLTEGVAAAITKRALENRKAK